MTVPLLAFAITLLVAVFLSQMAHKTALSTAVIFLIAGFLLGKGAVDLVQISPADPFIITFVEVALFSVLFADGMELGIKDLLKVWKLSGRALLLGLPLTLLFMALLAKLVIGLGWLESFLVGAVLSPTDPVFASAFVSRPEVPGRLRRLLNIESGLNDGLALPIVLLILSLLGVEEFNLIKWSVDILTGIAIGIVMPWIIFRMERMKLFDVARLYKPMLGLSIAMLVYALTRILQGNLFLAAFCAGIAIASVDANAGKTFKQFAEPVAELLKLGAVFVFGALLSWMVFTQVGWPGYLYALLVLFLARPAALLLSLTASPLGWRERIAAAWFGPRGFASVVYGLLVLSSGTPNASKLFQTISIVIIGSIIAHSTTDVIIARQFKNHTARSDDSQED